MERPVNSTPDVTQRPLCFSKALVAGVETMVKLKHRTFKLENLKHETLGLQLVLSDFQPNPFLCFCPLSGYRTSLAGTKNTNFHNQKKKLQ